LDKLDEVSDPMISLGSLVAYIDLAILRADYPSALRLSLRGLSIARRNRIELAVGPFLAGQVVALTGLRRPGVARVALDEFGGFAAARGDAYTALAYRSAAVRMDILGGSPTIEPINAEDRVLVPNLRVYIAAHMGLTAIVCAAAGKSSEALERCDQAVAIASTGETRAYAGLTRLIAGLRETPRSPDALEEGLRLLEGFQESELLDPLVLAYRVYPPMLAQLAENERAVVMLSDLLVASSDAKLAESAGISLASATGANRLLTPREVEVMGLVLRGLTNAEIAEELVISPGTAKVHVYNIMKKYGVRTRVELAFVVGQAEG
jgi:DNA-binding CsgD family transcriptional regulator